MEEQIPEILGIYIPEISVIQITEKCKDLRSTSKFP